MIDVQITEIATCSICGKAVSVEYVDYEIVDNNIYCYDCFDERFVICDNCRQAEIKDHATYHNHRYLCESCVDELLDICDNCGEYVDKDNVIYVDHNERYCKSCFDDLFIYCYNCGDPVRRDDSILAYDEYYCPDCYYNLFTECRHCGEIISYDDAIDGLCPSCYEDHGFILAHGDQPDELIFLPNMIADALYLGIELEVEAGDDDSMLCTAEYIHNNFKVWLNEDGSLGRNGYEIISHPATLEYHMNTFGWDKMLAELRSTGHTSHDNKRCGLHVHLSKSFFGIVNGRYSADAEEDNITKLVMFFERNWNIVRKISRRTDEQIDSWTRRYGIPPEIPDTKKAKEEINNRISSRYRAVNILPYHTVEIRIFRGTLRYGSFMATLQFCDAVARFVKETEYKDISWSNFIKYITNKPIYEILIDYLKERRVV